MGRAVRSVAGRAFLLHGGVNGPPLFELLGEIIVTVEAKRRLFRVQQAIMIGGMWLVTGETLAGRHRAVNDIGVVQQIIMAFHAQFRLVRVKQQFWESAAVGVVAGKTITGADRTMDRLPLEFVVAFITKVRAFLAESECVLFLIGRFMAGVTTAGLQYAMDDGRPSEGCVAPCIGAVPSSGNARSARTAGRLCQDQKPGRYETRRHGTLEPPVHGCFPIPVIGWVSNRIDTAPLSVISVSIRPGVSQHCSVTLSGLR